MKEKIFVKKNVFTCVMFGAIFLFVLYESIAKNTDLSMLAFFIGISTFLLSLINLIVDFAEDINDKITAFLQSVENYSNNLIDWEILSHIRENDGGDINTLVEQYCDSDSTNECVKETLIQYHKARISRKRARKIRRFFLYIYYGVFMILFVLLLLHSELAEICMSGVFENIDLNLFTIWSLIIILLEIMMKSIFEDFMIYCLDKRLGTNLEWY